LWKKKMTRPFTIHLRSLQKHFIWALSTIIFALCAQHLSLAQTNTFTQPCLADRAKPSVCIRPVPQVKGAAIPLLGDALEGESVTITWSLNSAVSQDVTFDINTVDGTAVAGTDYTPYSGSVLCPANQTTCTATPPANITMIDDGSADDTAAPINFVVHESNCVNVCNCSGCSGGPDSQVNIDEVKLKITSNGTALAAGKCASIQNTPAMPTIVASMVSPYYSGTLPGNVTWNLQVNYTGPDTPPTTYTYSVPDTAVAATSPFTIPWNSTYIGGQATLTYTYLAAAPQTFQFCINGLNPSADTVKTQLGTSPWFIRDIAYDESKYAQFNASKNPLFGAPHGFGIMQMDPPPSQLDVFDWTQNVTDGVSKVNGLGPGALAFWNRQVAQYTKCAAAHNNTPPPPSNDSEGTSCVFSYTPTGTEYPFSDAIWIKQYNGAAQNYIVWLNTGSHATNPLWQFYKCATTSVGTVCYVSRICSQNQ
jgi:hypothetical protein